MWPAAAHPADLELQLAVPTTVYHWLQAFHDLRWRSKPDRQIGSTHWQTWLQAARAARCRPRPLARARDASPRCGGPGPHAGTTHGAASQPTLRTSGGGRHSEVGAAPPAREGPTEPTKCPLCGGQVLHQRGDAGTPGVARGARCGPGGRQRRRPPTSCRGEHGGPRGTPRTPGAPRPRQPTTQMEVRRHPERPRGPAVRPHQGPCPSPRGWPPWPP